MYDHNQTLVPESFLALYVRNDRPVLERKSLEARYENAELLAQQIAAVMASIPADDDAAQREAFRNVRAGLLADALEGREPEAAWIITRVAEICEWAPPEV